MTDQKTPSWAALEHAHKALRPSHDPPPYAHLSDAELLAALDRARQGDPEAEPPYPGDPSTWPRTGLEHLSDAQLLAALWDVPAHRIPVALLRALPPAAQDAAMEHLRARCGIEGRRPR